MSITLASWRDSVMPVAVDKLRELTEMGSDGRFREMFGNAFFLTRHDPAAAPAPRGALTINAMVVTGARVATNKGWAHVLCHTSRSAYDTFISIGRTLNNDVVIEHPNVSRFHALVVARDNGFVLWDADSRHGTFVDGVRAGKRGESEPLALRSCALVRFGSVEMTFFDASGFLAALQ